MTITATAAATRRRVTVAATVAAAAGIDLFLKAVAETALNDTSIETGPITLRLAHNTGVAFSLGHTLPAWAIIAATGAITIGLAAYAWRHAPRATGWQLAAGALILAGAVANLIDRTTDGAVTDYLHTRWWPTFNLADIYLTLGVTVLAITLLRTNHAHTRSEPS